MSTLRNAIPSLLKSSEKLLKSSEKFLKSFTEGLNFLTCRDFDFDLNEEEIMVELLWPHQSMGGQNG